MSPTILVVDDERGVRELIVAVLEDEGYLAVGAASGAQAIEHLQAERPDLVLLDIMMPEMDGRETLRRIRSRADLADIPVIMMSAAVSANRVAADVAGFLPKPFDLDYLLEKVGKIVGPAD